MPKQPIPETYESLPVVTAQSMKNLDQLAAKKYQLPTLTLMEHAGRVLAEETSRYLKETLRVEIARANVVVCCGRGSNGGDGLVAARFLKQKGAAVSVFICPPRKEAVAAGGDNYPEPVRLNLQKARSAGVAVLQAGPEISLSEALSQAQVVLDALLGTGSAGKPAGAIHHMIQEITRSKKPVLAVDIPSGIHPDTGYHSGVFITAAETLTLGLAKRGLLAAHARKYVGKLKVLDIGYPKEALFEVVGSV